jgi:hypothetical protein
VTGDLRDRIAALVRRHRLLREVTLDGTYYECACGEKCPPVRSELPWHREHLTDVLLPLFAEVEANARAEALAPVRAVHARYFDLDGKPGRDDTDPEPEDVWRYDRDLRAALGDTPEDDSAGPADGWTGQGVGLGPGS